MDYTLDDIMRLAGHLPASQIADEVNGALASNGCAVVTAPPGAGKSTLLPLTILKGIDDTGAYPRSCRVLMLEPRRLAARQIAERMAATLGEHVGDTVGYRVRFDNRVSASTRIEVLTEGILTRMLISDPTLDGVAAVIFDEFHERSLHSDLALALARQCQQILRPDLKLVVMSATIDAASICDALEAPLIESQGRMYPVDTIYATEDAAAPDVAAAVAAAISRAHREHEGDVLAFLPGQGDIQQCAQMLGDSLAPTVVYPLYGHLSSEQQRKAIAPSKQGERKVVLATSIAETSVTIEGVRIVIDSGYCRRLSFDARTGLSHLETVRISADMATQRMGRAGRVAPGICCRLWTRATSHRMQPQRKPELIEADLAPMVLGIAAFGESDVASLPWLTPPPASSVAHAQSLLQLLGAIDEHCRITPLGSRMSQLSCHPRVSKMMLSAKSSSMKSLACDIAALLEEKDPLSQTEASADLSLRLSAFRASRRQRRLGRWSRVAQIAHEYMRMVNVKEDDDDACPENVGYLVAMAYPERVAKAVDDTWRYRLASGNDVQLAKEDPLAAFQWLAVASLNASDKCGRVFLAAPLRQDDIPTRTRDNVCWDSKGGSVIMRRETTVGVLVVDSHPLHEIDKDLVVSAICEAARKDGLSMFDWNESVARLQNRIAAVAAWHPDMNLPDLSTPRLLAAASEWLPLYIEQGGRLRTSVGELKKINMCDVIWGLVPYDQQQTIDRLAPSHIAVPTGSRIKVDYRPESAAPVLSVRLQECFGMERTPCVDGGRVPVLMELLSPGFKPVQLTQDLQSFWRNAYFDVRKELRRRYPKHHWPENPLEAEAVRGVKKK